MISFRRRGEFGELPLCSSQIVKSSGCFGRGSRRSLIPLWGNSHRNKFSRHRSTDIARVAAHAIYGAQYCCESAPYPPRAADSGGAGIRLRPTKSHQRLTQQDVSKSGLVSSRLKCTRILASATCGGDSTNNNTFSEITSIDRFVSFNS